MPLHAYTDFLCEEKTVEAEVSESVSSLVWGNPNRDFMLCASALCLDGIARNAIQTRLNMGPTFKRTP